MKAPRRWRTIGAAGAMVIGATAIWAGPAASHHQGGPTASCRGTDRVVRWGAERGFGQNPEAIIFSHPVAAQSRLVTLDEPLDTGRYAIDAVTYDGYHGREGMTQPYEQVVFELLAADGTIVVTTGPTTDLADRVLEATAVTDLGTVTVDRPVVAVRARAFYRGADKTPNSVEAICLGFSLVTQPTADVVTTTTAPPVEVPAPEAAAPTPNPESPAPLAPTTPVSIVVGGVVELPLTPPAQAIVGRPTFTG